MKFKLMSTILVFTILTSFNILGQTQFVKHINNPIYNNTPLQLDDYVIINNCVVYESGKYNMYYAAKDKGINSMSLNMYIGYTYSVDGMTWENNNKNLIISSDEKWEKYGFLDAMVIVVNSIWHMWYVCPADEKISDTYLGYATSRDGIKWEKREGKLNFFKSKEGWDSGGIFPLSIVYNGSNFIMYYKAYANSDYLAANKNCAVGMAESVDGITWEKNLASNPVLEFRDEESLEYNILNLSVIYNKENVDNPYQIWYTANNRRVDKNDYIFHASSKKGRIWKKTPQTLCNNSKDYWSKNGFSDIEIVQVGKTYKMWMVGKTTRESVIGYAEDFTNSAHCTCLSIDCRYNQCGGAPEDICSKVCNPTDEKVYVWARIKCTKGSENQIHQMHGGEGGYEIVDRVHCPGDKFYTFSSFITSDPAGTDVLFDSKYFYVDKKFTTVPAPKVEVINIEKGIFKADYRAKLKLENVSETTGIENPQVIVSAANSSIELIVSETIEFNNIKQGESETRYIYFDIIDNDDVRLDFDFEILSDGVHYWSNSFSTTLLAVDDKSSQSLNNFTLSQNYPNPFNPSTVISYQLPSSVKGETANSLPAFGVVKLVVYDILGKEVTTLVDEEQKPGYYEVVFDASSLSSGLYFYKLEAGSFTETKKMILIR
ncbi:MAG: T9SS type A sorting domain-containing protein [Bacteroidota bacterium]